jgi:hypothetical protein
LEGHTGPKFKFQKYSSETLSMIHEICEEWPENGRNHAGRTTAVALLESYDQLLRIKLA